MDFLVPVLVAVIGALATVAASYVALQKGREDERKRSEPVRIADLLRKASPGDRIVVPRGVYDEQLFIDKAIEIVGDGRRSDVVIQVANGTAIVCTGVDIALRGLTIRQRGGRDWNAIDIADGSVTLDACEVTSESSDAIVVRRGAFANLRGTTISQSPRSGIRFLTGSGGHLRGCVVSNSDRQGVSIESSCNVVVERSAIRFSAEDGIGLDSTEGIVQICGNEFVGNLGNAVSVRGSGTLDLALTDNDVRNCGQAGFRIEGDQVALIEANRISVSGTGVFVVGGSSRLRANRIFDIKGSGVMITGRSKARLEQNVIRRCLLFGLHVDADSDPEVVQNSVEECERGIGVTGNSRGAFEANDIRRHATDGVSVRNGSHPSFRNNTVEENLSDGFYFVLGASGDLEGNSIISNSGDGVVVKGSGRPSLRSNRVAENGNHGIYVHDGGGCHLDSNDVTGNGGEALKIADDCVSNVTHQRPTPVIGETANAT